LALCDPLRTPCTAVSGKDEKHAEANNNKLLFSHIEEKGPQGILINVLWRGWCGQTVTVTLSEETGRMAMERKRTTRWCLPLLPSARDFHSLSIHTPAWPICLALHRLVLPISAASWDIGVLEAGGCKLLHFTFCGAWKRYGNKGDSVINAVFAACTAVAVTALSIPALSLVEQPQTAVTLSPSGSPSRNTHLLAADYLHRNLPEMTNCTARNRLCNIRYRVLSVKVEARSRLAKMVS
jgi:hypothetical protein